MAQILHATHQDLAQSRQRLNIIQLSFLCWLLLLGLGGCEQIWNSPYPKQEQKENILYDHYSEQPKYLDPARSYSSDEAEFTEQIYEPPLQYHYLERPYKLITNTAEQMPSIEFKDATGVTLPENANEKLVAQSWYTIRIKPGIKFQPHPAFAIDEQKKPRYLNLTENDLTGITTPYDFKYQDTRELTAEDYVYQIKRLAHPKLSSPILSHMSHYIVGLEDYAKLLRNEYVALVKTSDTKTPWLDLRKYPLSGVEVIDRYTYRIKLNGVYPQFSYWLSMPFFAPMPYEAEQFYNQAGMAKRNLTLNWWPVGTGPYMLTENNPNARMVLSKNPNYRGETYPSTGEPDDIQKGFLKDAGKTLPFIDKVVFSREKESVPIWNKFLQGYYDSSGVSADNFDQAVRFNGGLNDLTEDIKAKNIRLQTAASPSIFYLGFNMFDPIVGHHKNPIQEEKNRKLRQAISIAIDYEEYINIFANGRGQVAHSPIIPGVFGYRDPLQDSKGINQNLYDIKNNKPTKKSLKEAKALLAQAGYPNGIGANGKPLVLGFDTTDGGVDGKAGMDWYRNQFAKLGIQLEIRTTDWNRYQEKLRNGKTQLFFLGWNADYPDPENFLFLLYGQNARFSPDGKGNADGENSSNYQNKRFDELFAQVKNIPDSLIRQALIDEMVKIVQHDCPWVMAFYPTAFGLYHQWVTNTKPHAMARNTLKYRRIDQNLRQNSRTTWNQAKPYPFFAGLVIMVILIIISWKGWHKSQQKTAREIYQ